MVLRRVLVEIFEGGEGALAGLDFVQDEARFVSRFT
jgi:hypothetical protein